MFRHERQGTLSFISMAFIRPRGLKAVSRCAYSMTGMFKGEIGIHHGDQGSALEKVFPDNTLLREEDFVLFSRALL